MGRQRIVRIVDGYVGLEQRSSCEECVHNLGNLKSDYQFSECTFYQRVNEACCDAIYRPITEFSPERLAKFKLLGGEE